MSKSIYESLVPKPVYKDKEDEFKDGTLGNILVSGREGTLCAIHVAVKGLKPAFLGSVHFGDPDRDKKIVKIVSSCLQLKVPEDAKSLQDFKPYVGTVLSKKAMNCLKCRISALTKVVSWRNVNSSITVYPDADTER